MLAVAAAYTVTLALDQGPELSSRHLAIQKSLDEATSYVSSYGINGLTKSPELLSVSRNIDIEVSDSDAKTISSLRQSDYSVNTGRWDLSSLFTRSVSDTSPVSDPDGNELTVTAKTRLSSSETFHSLMRRPLIPLIVFAFISWLLSLLLARYLFAPLKHMRHIASLLADGHIGARVHRSTTSRWDGFGRLATDFNRMSDRLEQGFQQQQRIVRELNQELLIPYDQIREALDIAQLYPTDQRLEAVQTGLDNLQKVINHGVALSGDENTRPLEEHGIIEIVELVSNVVRVSDYEATHNAKHVRLHLATPVWVNGNEQLIEEAVENVVKNAVHNTKTGGTVEVEVRSRRKQDAESYVDICINEQGPTVPDAVLAQLFDSNYESDKSGSSDGRRFGLSLAERTVRLHDGTIIARNRVDGEGLRIVIRLPMADSPARTRTNVN